MHTLTEADFDENPQKKYVVTARDLRNLFNYLGIGPAEYWLERQGSKLLMLTTTAGHGTYTTVFTGISNK